MTQSCVPARTANLLGALALATADRVDRAAQDAGGRSGTETAALVVLTTVLGGGSQEALRRVLALTQTGTTRLVTRLVDAGLVERRDGPDGRTRALVPTARGREVATGALAARATVLAGVLGRLDDGEQEQAAALLEKLLTGLVDGPDAPMRICRLCEPDVCGHPDRCPVTQASARPT
jgi:MarR family transcriptional regulator, negative regulator of the multidrug operon emrRAB